MRNAMKVTPDPGRWGGWETGKKGNVKWKGQGPVTSAAPRLVVSESANVNGL